MGGSAQSTAAAQGYCCEQASSMAKTEVQGIPALLLEAIDVEDPIAVGGMETYHITVTNQGSAPDRNVVVEVNFEEEFDIASQKGPTSAKISKPKTVQFEPLASLAPGQKATWTVTAKAVKAGDHRTAIKLTSSEFDRPIEETESTRAY